MANFDQLNPKVQRWVWQQGWSDLKPIQQNSIPPIIDADRDVIIAAPTAGGKTEAAYLPILSSLLDTPPHGEGFAVLNISPLKALINDQNLRLQQMTADMGICVTPWHGDVSASTKSSSLRHPEGILLITPESLEGMFVNKPHLLERAFANLRYVVVDELHAFMAGERGVQLQSLLARLEAVIGRRVPRIALSATFSDYAQAADFLRPHRGVYPFSVPDAGKEGHPTLILVKEFTTGGEQQFDQATATDLMAHLRGSNNLVFTNSRKEAEALALKLKDMSQEQGVPCEFVLHHGSLSRSDRHHVESTLKEGRLPTTAICTSTLELGIDIGQVQSIAQLVSANSVSALRQRLGRSGRRGSPSVLRIYSMDEERDDYKYHLRTNLVQNIAVVELLSKSIYEAYNPAVPHYSTLIQQLLSLTAQYGGFYAESAWQMLCRDGAFSNVPPADFLDVLKALGQKNIFTQLSTGQIVISSEGERLLKSRDFYTAFVTLRDFNVVDKATGQSVGNIQYKPYVGEYILLAAHRWLVETVDDHTGIIGVNAAHTTGKMMFEGYGQEIDGIIARKMREIYECDDAYPYLDANTLAPQNLQAARDYYRSLDLAPGKCIDINGERLLFTWGGMKLNRTLALMHKAAGFPLPAFDAYAVQDVPASYLATLRTAPPDPEVLAAEVPRGRKLTEKYDYLLPDHLLNKKFAATHLLPN